jgi:tRNA A37 threonylcarbamoyladenosine biosynthesis protein TsaE
MEMFEDDSCITVIEWPEIIESILPEGVIRIRFEVINENTRKVTLENIKLT